MEAKIEKHQISQQKLIIAGLQAKLNPNTGITLIWSTLDAKDKAEIEENLFQAYYKLAELYFEYGEVSQALNQLALIKDQYPKKSEGQKEEISKLESQCLSKLGNDYQCLL